MRNNLTNYLNDKIKTGNMKYFYNAGKIGSLYSTDVRFDEHWEEFNEEVKIVKEWLKKADEETINNINDLDFWKELGVGEMYRIEYSHQLVFLPYPKHNTLDEITMQVEFGDEINQVKMWINEYKQNKTQTV